jgi:flagellar assembly protein FliH
MSTKEKPANKRPEEMTAYERWELPNLQQGAESESLRPPTAAELEKIREQAYQEGFQQGRDEGLQKGKEEGLELGRQEGIKQGISEGLKHADVKLDETKKSLESIMRQLLIPVEDEQERLEQVMLNVVLAVTRSVIHSEIKTRTDVIGAALNRALMTVPKSAENVTIKLNPDDIEAVQPIVSGLSPETNIKPDTGILRGGCVVESSDQLVDFTIEKRFQKAVQAMLLEASNSSGGEVLSESPEELQSHTDFPSELLDEDLPQEDSGESDDQSS